MATNVGAPAVPAGENVKKNRVWEMADKHPYILAAIVIVTVLIVLWLVFKDYCWDGLSALTKSRKKKSDGSSDERQQILDLISSIEKKQKNTAEKPDE